MAKFRGIMVPITTPFDACGNILWDEFEKHINHVLSKGVNSILIPSGTGEFENLTIDERTELTARAAEVIKHRVPLVSMISDCSTKNVLEIAKRAKEAGATEAMMTPPYFTVINQRAIKLFFLEVADKIELPLWIYHQPGETKLSVAPETAVELAKHPNIIGMKIAPAEDFLYFTRIVRLLDGNDSFSLLNGEDFDLFASLLIGGDGGVASLANIIPEHFVTLFNSVQNGDIKTARKMHEHIMDAFDCAVDVTTGNYQSALKTILIAQGLYSTNVMSSPFQTILPEEQRRILSMACQYGIIDEESFRRF
ncbi:MAG: dihydrodipicolinate synthase family protein [Oscillospiraceae bacterium]|nr:dihydrodipicolinate synthase family protein [Oscillospiraceae bacterium]